MLGVVITLFVCFGAVGVGRWLVNRWIAELDPAAGFGVSGLVGLGAFGLLTFAVASIPGDAVASAGVVGALALAGAALQVATRNVPPLRRPEGLQMLIPVGIAIFAMLVLISTLAPSDMTDWDSLAYHLALPKRWIETGQLAAYPGIHHSNFPLGVDALYLPGLVWGGESGAKAFSLGYFLLGLPLIFGIARKRYGGDAGFWATLAYAGVPLVLWEAGSAYIDLAHGLYAGGAVLLALEGAAIPAGLLLGFAMGSKYTGLQTMAVLGFVLLVLAYRSEERAEGMRRMGLIVGVACLVAAPWYVRTAADKGNPVYPFFYEQLRGREWDQRRADIYRNEQQKFGVGRDPVTLKRSPAAIGHAIFGLAYQPGRYVNPAQEQGLGSPLGAIGLGVLCALVVWPLAGRIRRYEAGVLAVAGLSLFLWFFLSQQSRYVLALVPPLAVLAGGAATLRGLRIAIASVIGVQALASLWLVQTLRTTDQIRVAVGAETPDAFRRARIPLAAAAEDLNREVGKAGKVALYDEVFGYLLDVPYYWANPGHSTWIPYDGMGSAADYEREMRKRGFTHVYLSLSSIVKERSFAGRWLATMGLNPGAEGLSDDEAKSIRDNWERKWEILVADAVREGRLVPVGQWRSGLLLRFKA